MCPGSKKEQRAPRCRERDGHIRIERDGLWRHRELELACARVFCYFDLSLVPKRRMRLISWLAFGSFCGCLCFFGFISVSWPGERDRARQWVGPGKGWSSRWMSCLGLRKSGSKALRSIRQRLLGGCRVCRLNRTTTGDIKIMKCAGVVDSLLARSGLQSSVSSPQSSVFGLGSLRWAWSSQPEHASRPDSGTDWPIGATVDCRTLRRLQIAESCLAQRCGVGVP